mmetsp:Transcript_7032/g.10291  ORF Transcript_7032/g.10291 Transcript_7032/m.10291 type:complete len:237 (-) Transcript_7032:91-801(-)|eukprot:CAMPEP_0197235216 /NCGR_PEP_ID=MMETSP1429-20130617/2699_1 /TAXON_ID=49237 /ORGANISM="Chaetoceros  sp., Strain UNC1202" /LENGTH=236 /DNA_ID=CAMNT_0042693753 /DNA_START=85 /DNA_END=795 /DNA_ORIENTATION=-
MKLLIQLYPVLQIFRSAHASLIYSEGEIQLPRSSPYDETNPSSTCGPNERYTTCASSTCFEETCNDILLPESLHKICTKDCRQGCQCKSGYYRNHDGRCVTELSCALCGYGEDWTDCGYNNTCVGEFELTCDLNGLGTDISSNGCYCALDYYRTDKGLCVSRDSCDKCDMNEVYESCGSSSCWEFTCDDVGTLVSDRWQPRPCTLDCQQGCKCFPGFYRDESLGDCISAEMCIMRD